MKRIYTYLGVAVFGVLSLVSCSNDDNSTPPVEDVDPIVGSWDLNSFDLRIYQNDELYLEMEDVSAEGIMLMQFDFKADNTVEFIYGEVNQAGEMVEYSEMGTYTKNDDSVTITIDGEAETFTILKLNSAELHLFVTDEYSFEGVNYVDEITFKMVSM